MKLMLLAAANSVHTVRWANAFVERGIETHLVSQHTVGAGLSPRVSVHVLPHFGGAGYFLNYRRLRTLVNTLRPDVLNAHYATGYGTLARAIRTVPVVLNVWGSDVYEFPEKGPVHRWLVRRNLRAAHRLVSTSEVMAERVRHWVPDLPKPTVVPFGVDTDRFKPASTPRSGTPVVIGTVKTLAHTYGIDTLIEAFALLNGCAHLPPCVLRIVGGGPDRGALERRAKALGIGDRVEFSGPVPHARVPEALRGFDVFAALSREESFGVAVIEASACGLPVVVSDAGGLAEVVVGGVTGTIVARNDPPTAAKAIAELVLSNVQRARMGEAGRAQVVEKYEWSSCVGRMIAILSRCTEH